MQSDTLRRLFERGLSDEEIAVTLGDRTNLAITTRRREMGLTRDSGQLRNPPRPMMVVGPAATCQWFDGEPPKASQPDFCGRPSVFGKSYCPKHVARVYKPSMDMSDAGGAGGRARPRAQTPEAAERAGEPGVRECFLLRGAPG